MVTIPNMSIDCGVSQGHRGVFLVPHYLSYTRINKICNLNINDQIKKIPLRRPKGKVKDYVKKDDDIGIGNQMEYSN